MKYSDELANGDRDDDKENQFEHDPTDPIVDYNGHTNRGYGHTPYDQVDAPYRFDKQHYETNHVKDLFPEHFGTKPQGDNPFCSTCWAAGIVPLMKKNEWKAQTFYYEEWDFNFKKYIS